MSICKKRMPKEMSDWLDERIKSGQNKSVDIDGMKGYAMRSDDTVVVFFPFQDCEKQFDDIVSIINKTENQNYY